MPIPAKRVDIKTNRKVISISSKRQITIPQKSVSGGEFAEQILEDLIKEGLSGEALLSEFKERQAQIRPAVESMLSEAEAVAEGKSDFATYDDVFRKRG
jgi:hypothetical protein